MSIRIFCGKISGAAALLCIMALVFHLTFNVIGKALSDMLTKPIDAAASAAGVLLTEAGAPIMVRSLILDGIFPGVGAVLSFVPVIGILFFFLSILEESGYLSQAASLMDAPMRRFGLPGRVVVPMIMGFGCNVPAIMTAGALLEGREKNAAIMMIPFMSCSARLPIYAMLISAFFTDHRLIIIAALYLIGIITALLYALLIKNVSGRLPKLAGPVSCGGTCPSCSPLSAYDKPQGLRLPSLRNVLRSVTLSCAAFIKKAFTVILLASVIIWFLRSFDAGLHPTADSSASLLAYMGKASSPFFEPLGFGDWRAASALISGLFAKEAVVSTLAILSASGGSAGASAYGAASAVLTDAFTPLSAFCFMTFCLLYIPCIAALAAIGKETGSRKFALALSALQIASAWGVSFLIFQTGTFIMQV